MANLGNDHSLRQIGFLWAIEIRSHQERIRGAWFRGPVLGREDIRTDYSPGRQGLVLRIHELNLPGMNIDVEGFRLG